MVSKCSLSHTIYGKKRCVIYITDLIEIPLKVKIDSQKELQLKEPCFFIITFHYTPFL